MKEDTLQLLVLTFVLLLYMAIGAGVFSALELSNEVKLRKYYYSIFESFAKKNNLSSSALSSLLTSQKEACLLGVTLDQHNKWDFAGSFYFTGTVITTIGFGLTAPSTYEGQLFFIFYAIIGIPLNILYLNTALQKIVSILSDVVRSGYKYMPKNKFLTPPGAKELPLGEMLIASFVIYFCVTLIIAIFFAWIEGWTFFQAVYFLVVACSTVGFGDYVPSKLKTGAEHNIHEGYRVSNWFMIGFGVLLMYVVLNLLANLFRNILGKCIDACHFWACSCLKSQVEPYDSQKTGVSAQPSTRRTVSRISVANDLEGADLGSFAAIQLALDRLKMEASADDQGSNTELKALSSIEKILQAEYFKVKSRKKSNSVRSRWRRAAQKARQLSPNKETGLSNEDINGPIRAALSIENEKYEDLPGVVQ